MNKKISIDKQKIWTAVGCCIIAILMGTIIWNSPLVSDDLYYSSFQLNSFKEILKFAAGYGNGRLLGNIFVHYIIKSPLLRVFFHLAGLAILIALIHDTTKSPEHSNIFLTIALFFFVQPYIFRESYLWSSAFANYVPGIICMFLARKIVTKKSTHPIRMFLLLIISVAGQLFVEHTTIINLFVAFFTLIVSIYEKNNNKCTLSVVWFLGTATGTVIMWIVPKLFCVVNEFGNYRKLNILGIYDFVVSLASNASQIAGLYFQNFFTLLLLSTIVIILCTKICLFSKIMLIFAPLYGFFTNFIIDDWWNGLYLDLVDFIFFTVYGLLIMRELLKEQHISHKPHAISSLGLCIFSFLPLLIVYPIGARCLLHSYVFLIIGILILINYNFDRISLIIPHILKPTVTFTSSLIFFSCLSAHFFYIKDIDIERLEYVTQMVESGAEQITLPQLPSYYVKEFHGWAYGQLFYHKEKEDIEFVFIDYDDWSKGYSKSTE